MPQGDNGEYVEAKVAARFYVAETHKYAAMGGFAEPKPGGKVIMRAVSRGEHNKVWASATPAGLIEMTVRGSAFGWFESRLGQELAITFQDAPPEE